MVLSTTQNLNNLNLEEIKEKIIEINKEILELNIQKATKQNIKTHILKLKKHTLAQLLTIETIKLKKEHGN